MTEDDQSSRKVMLSGNSIDLPDDRRVSVMADEDTTSVYLVFNNAERETVVMLSPEAAEALKQLLAARKLTTTQAVHAWVWPFVYNVLGKK